jgi:hypothetical protein
MAYQDMWLGQFSIFSLKHLKGIFQAPSLFFKKIPNFKIDLIEQNFYALARMSNVFYFHIWSSYKFG